MELDSVTGKEETFFEVVEVSRMHNALSFHNLIEINIGQNLDARRISRSVYNIFTLLGDVGGFYGLVGGLCAAINGVFAFQKGENILSEKLYTSSEVAAATNAKQSQETLNASKQWAIIEYL